MTRMMASGGGWRASSVWKLYLARVSDLRVCSLECDTLAEKLTLTGPKPALPPISASDASLEVSASDWVTSSSKSIVPRLDAHHRMHDGGNHRNGQMARLAADFLAFGVDDGLVVFEVDHHRLAILDADGIEEFGVGITCRLLSVDHCNQWRTDHLVHGQGIDDATCKTGVECHEDLHYLRVDEMPRSIDAQRRRNPRATSVCVGLSFAEIGLND